MRCYTDVLEILNLNNLLTCICQNDEVADLVDKLTKQKTNFTPESLKWKYPFLESLDTITMNAWVLRGEAPPWLFCSHLTVPNSAL